MPKPSNKEIAHVLDTIADLLEAQDANPHRVRAYRTGAQSVEDADEQVANLVHEGKQEDLRELPGIGKGLAGVIREYVETGRSGLLERLQGEMSPGELFAQVPGIGPTLGKRIAQTLDVQSLEELERAAHDGRLQQVEGFGEERVRNVRVALAGMLSRAAQRRAATGRSDEPDQDQPDVGTLLEVDAEYRRRAEAGELKKIAPKRFNPDNEAWLPIMHTEEDGWSFTALYSNTARAHDLDKTHDWVVIYFDQDGEEGQATVVTKHGGSLDGKRIVRGRETESKGYYEQQ
jgi:DNA uptake protein ComE-like DNA-binding protein